MKVVLSNSAISFACQQQQEKLVSLIREVIEPDMVFLLGSSMHHQSVYSIFSATPQESQQMADYFLLVLVSHTQNKQLSQWQDQLEQYCDTVATTTTIVLETNIFNQWLSSDHPFARTVIQSCSPIYQAAHCSLSPLGEHHPETEIKMLEKQYREGFSKGREFLAGADLFRIRKHCKLAMFMSHQATEQILSTVIKMGMGYYCCTHNIERLLRYASWVYVPINIPFPRNTVNEKRLFTLLQKAYIYSRYHEDYSVETKDVCALTEKVKSLLDSLAELGKQLQQKSN